MPTDDRMHERVRLMR